MTTEQQAVSNMVQSIQETPQTDVVQTTVVDTPAQANPEAKVETVVAPISEIDYSKAPAPFELPTQSTQEQQTQQNIQTVDEWTPENVVQKFKGKEEVLLKSLGFDDYLVNAINEYKSKGSLAEYARAMQDWNKVSDEQIVEAKLREQYAAAGMPEETIKLLVEDEMQKKYPLQSDSERDVEIAKGRLKFDAAQRRAELFEIQAKYKAPERVAQQQQPEVTPKQLIAQEYQSLVADPDIQSFLKAPKITYGEKENAFNYDVKNPQDNLRVIADPNFYLSKIAKKDATGNYVTSNGQLVVDRARLNRIANYINNGDEVERNLINHGITLGKKQEITSSENPTDNRTQGTQSTSETFEDAMLRKLKQVG